VVQVDSWPKHPASPGTQLDTRGHVSLALVGQVSIRHLDFSVCYKLENVAYSHVASVHRQTKMHDLFIVPNH